MIPLLVKNVHCATVLADILKRCTSLASLPSVDHLTKIRRAQAEDKPLTPDHEPLKYDFEL